MIRRYFAAYAGLPREIWSLGFLTVLNRMGTMVLPFLSVYLNTELNFSLQEVGVLMSAFGLGSFGGAYIGGKLVDRIGPNWVIILSLSISGFFLISLQWMQSYEWLFVMIGLTSLFGEAYRPAVTAAIGQYVPANERGRAVAFIRLAINLGMSGAPLIGGFVATSLGYPFLFWIDGLTCLFASIYFVIVSRDWERPVLKPPTEEEIAKGNSLRPYQNRKYLLFLVATFLLGFGFVQWFHAVPVFIKTVWHFDERYIGTFMAVSCLMVVTIEMPLIHAIEKGGRIQLALILGAILIGGSYLLFLLPASLALCFVAVAFWTMGEILYLPFNSALSLNYSPEDQRGNYQAWYWMTWSLASISAPLIGLPFAERFGFDTFWFLVAGVVALCVVINLVQREVPG